MYAKFVIIVNNGSEVPDCIVQWKSLLLSKKIQYSG